MNNRMLYSQLQEAYARAKAREKGEQDGQGHVHDDSEGRVRRGAPGAPGSITGTVMETLVARLCLWCVADRGVDQCPITFVANLDDERWDPSEWEGAAEAP